MKKSIGLFVILAVVIIFSRQVFLHGLLPIPSDTLIGLYNPFRDFYAQQYPRGVPFKNFLITDPIRQQYPWRELAISTEKKMQLPLWNPYSFSGYPLLANFQSGAFYPLNIFFFFLPFSLSWSLLILLQPLLAGIFLYFYLRNLKLHSLASLLGALTFTFSGFSVAWLEWGTIVQTLMWIPLILLAKDKLLEKWTIGWILVFFFAEIAAVFAGHIQILFYGICLTNIYLFIRAFQKAHKIKGSFILNYAKVYMPFLLVGIVIYVTTAIQWIPTLQFILNSARSVDQNYLTTAGWFIPWQHLVQFVIPDFFGNPTTLNYWGVWNYGELVGYIGILPLLFVFFALIARHDKKTYFFVLLALISLLFALPTSLAQLPYQLNLPFLSTSQPTRLMGIVDLAFAILAALGFDYLIIKKNVRWQLLAAISFVGLIFIGIWIVVLQFHLGFSLENLVITRHNLIFPTSIFVGVFVILILFLLSKSYLPRKIQMTILGVLLLITVIDQLRFAEKFTPFTPTIYLYPQTASIAFLQQNIGNYRFMTTDSQILPPNVSNIYRLQSIEGYDPLYLQNYGAFIAAIQRKKPDISTPFGFNRIITPHDIQNPFINLLGVKYILSFVDLSDKSYKKVFQEGQTKIYENTNVFPRAFFAATVMSVNGQQNAIDAVFANENDLSHVAIVESVSALPSSKGLAKITSYTSNRIVINTDNQQQGFLVLTDIYYPTWHATIDGIETKIYKTDFTFRGIIVPMGKHRVEFSDSLF